MSVTHEVTVTCGAARRGVLHTPHFSVQTPCFMPVATQGSVKALSPEDVTSTGAEMVIMNTYHLWLRPGSELVRDLGGLHEFTRWPRAIATDSGGFQAFSLAERTKLTEAGFEFASHLDGSRHLLTPEESMRVQGELGSDIALQLDVCPPGGAAREEVEQACARTTRWAERCLRARADSQALFGIVQGGVFDDLRCRHADELARLEVDGRRFDGLALGGYSVGEPPSEMWRSLVGVVKAVDPARPRYLMGVGTPSDLVHAIGCGVDIFDCVMPTRNARNGSVFTSSGKLNIKSSVNRDDRRVLDESCVCVVCREGYTRATLRHLFVAGEILALRLLSLHNVAFYQRVVREAREQIAAGSYAEWAQARLAELGGPALPRSRAGSSA